MNVSGDHKLPSGLHQKVLVVVGTRPDAIKLAPVVEALSKHPSMEPVVVSTGQHREMLDQVLGLFGTTPDADLDLMRPGQSLSELTRRALHGLTGVMEQLKPDAVVVQGDTTTAMVAALAAFYAQVPVTHVEAGLRSGTLSEPFPEEANRRMISVLVDQHLAPTPGARENLVREGADARQIHVTGNTVIDALHWVTGLSRAVADPTVSMLERDERLVVLVTAHRRESWGLPLFRVGLALAEIARAFPEVVFACPTHRNPQVRESLKGPLAGLDNVVFTEPLDYHSFCRLLARSHVVVTDSGGIQEEAPSLGKPVLVLRDVTERPEGVAAGTARLVGTRGSSVTTALTDLLTDELAYARMANVANPYGDGHAAERTVSAIAYQLELGPPPRPFDPCRSDDRAVMSDNPTDFIEIGA